MNQARGDKAKAIVHRRGSTNGYGGNKRIKAFLILLSIIYAGYWLCSCTFKKEKGDYMEKNGRKLVWSDEFDGTDKTAVDDSKWVHDIGGTGWGNKELEYYTDSVSNSYQENGCLVIEAKKEQKGDNPYTSARITTKGRYEFQYGRVEMRAKIPYGQGIWPAFWMLGSDIDDNPWPSCGEIDIMENIGKEPYTIHGTVHGPGYSGALGIGSPLTIDDRFADDFHEYAIEWTEDQIDWYVDGKLYHTMNPNKVIGNKWVYNSKFYILLNLAVGGEWPGYPDDTTAMPQKYVVDYVRVYQ